MQFILLHPKQEVIWIHADQRGTASNRHQAFQRTMKIRPLKGMIGAWPFIKTIRYKDSKVLRGLNLMANSLERPGK
jgi:hypothetical protein